jgi:hypothetical protein
VGVEQQTESPSSLLRFLEALGRQLDLEETIDVVEHATGLGIRVPPTVFHAENAQEGSKVANDVIADWVRRQKYRFKPLNIIVTLLFEWLC